MNDADNRLRVLIADDHPIFRQGLKAIIADDTSLELVAEADNGESALKQIKFLKPDLVILDLAMPGMDGLRVLELAKQELPELLVSVVTSYSDQAYLDKALELGAAGYVLKDEAGEDLLACLRAVRAGQRYISPVFGNQHTQLPITDSEQISALDELTPMELKVLAMVAKFMTSKEIAANLFISYRTVQNHRANIARKLELRGIHHLSQFAHKYEDQLNARVQELG